MTRKRGEENASQEKSSIGNGTLIPPQPQMQSVRGTKTSQAAAAAKLEKYAHTPAHIAAHTPTKGQWVQQPKDPGPSIGDISICGKRPGVQEKGTERRDGDNYRTSGGG